MRDTTPASPRTPSLALFVALTAAACSGATGVTDDDDDSTTTGDGTSTTTGSEGDETAGSCGNGTIDGDEACDGSDLGGQACAMGGTLACTALCTLDATGCTVDPTQAVVHLNEIVADDVVEGPYAGAGDALELHNLGGAVADLSGWRLSDDPMLPDDKTYVFPAGTSLAPGAVLVLVRLDEDTGEGDYPFGISTSEPETLTLVDAQGAVLDVASFLGPDAVVSWCRVLDGDGEWQTCTQTLGSLNASDDDPLPG